MNLAQQIRFEILQMRINLYKLTTDARGPWEERKHPRGRGGKFKKKGSYYGTLAFVDNKALKRYNRKLKGTPTSEGVKISKVTGHAAGRMMHRYVSFSQVKKCLQQKYKVSKTEGEPIHLYEQNEYRAVINGDTGALISVVDLNEKRKEEAYKKWKKEHGAKNSTKNSRNMSKKFLDLQKKKSDK